MDNGKDKNYQEELNKARSEMEMFYDIGNAMRTTLNLEEILYIILTAATSHTGLSFNRSMLFLVNEKENRLEGKMGIGPDSAEDATNIWAHIEKNKIGLEELISVETQFDHLKKSKLNQTIKSIKILIKKDSGVIALTALEGVPFIINTSEAKQKAQDSFSTLLDLDEFVTVPLKAKNKVIGVLLADNRFNKKPITIDAVRILTMFANQAGLAIENSRLYEQTVVLSNSDSLTGLWNHGYFQYLLGEEIKKSSLAKSYFTLFLIDIDNFKEFNDTYGHQTGDSIIREISKIFRDASRKIDIVARYGGEEFGIILPMTKKEEALVLAERIRKAVETSPGLKNITISIGVASYPTDCTTKEDLIAKTDKALYEAKRSGKNRICV
ncbi:MAG: sensor domain-containing diguanylate cyclase [Candidatus Omnitrophica bacterium]|nr:sensor domain-containing diguanylate cyclase [Candidatus Omnitrophota bacterium]